MRGTTFTMNSTGATLPVMTMFQPGLGPMRWRAGMPPPPPRQGGAPPASPGWWLSVGRRATGSCDWLTLYN